MVQVCATGRKSVRVTPVELPVPPAVTVMMYPALSPAVTVAGLAVLSTLTSGHCTVMVGAVELLLALLVSLVELTLAVLLIGVAQSAAVVVPLSVICLVLPWAIVPKVQVRVAPPARVAAPQSVAL